MSSRIVSAADEVSRLQQRFGPFVNVLWLIATALIAGASGIVSASYLTGRYVEKISLLEERVKSHEDQLRILADSFASANRISVEAQKTASCIELLKLDAAPKPPPQPSQKMVVMHFGPTPAEEMFTKLGCTSKN